MNAHLTPFLSLPFLHPIVKKRPQAKRPAAALSARALSRGHPRWLRFYTGFRSYARFQAFLAFLQSADGTMLAQSCLSEAEEGVEEEEEEGR